MDYEKEIKNLRLEVDELKSLLNNSIHTAGYARTVESSAICPGCSKSFPVGQMNTTNTGFMCFKCWDEKPVDKVKDVWQKYNRACNYAGYEKDLKAAFRKAVAPLLESGEAVEAYIHHSNLEMLLDTGSACEVDISHRKEDGYVKVKIIRIGE